MNTIFHPPNKRRIGFTLIEVLVSMVILSMILMVVTSVIGAAQRTWKSATSRLTQFREARVAFDTVTRNLQQAMIKSYVDYNLRETPFIAPERVLRKAELGIRFDQATSIVSGGGSGQELPGHAVIFQAPLGQTLSSNSIYRPLKSLLCTRGYFVQFGTDASFLPSELFAQNRLRERYRYRLIEYQPPTELNEVYTQGAKGDWATVSMGTGRDYLRVVASNIVALVLAPSFSQAESSGAAGQIGERIEDAIYTFSSYAEGGTFNGRSTLHRMPASVQVVMVAMDEESAARLTPGAVVPDVLGKAGANFTSPGNLQQDIRAVRDYLNRLKMNYRIFSSNVFLLANEI
jgi:uncharacterized protein (TIGR02599 family)